jgi:glycosyltransferase involved in cell wall biosynthesis
MNLLHVISSMDPAFGGLSQAVRNLVGPLKKLGVDSEVVSLDDPSNAFIKEDAFRIHAIGPWKGPWSYSANLSPWLKDNLDKFDAVIIHGLWLYHGYSTAKSIREFRSIKTDTRHRARPRLFVMPHGMLDPYFQRAEERKLKAFRNWIYWKVIESKVVNGSDGLLFTCEEERELARQPFRPYKPKREINVGLGIQAPPLHVQGMDVSFQTKCPEVMGRTYILFLGRIHEKKGVDVLIKSFRTIRSISASSQNVVLVIAGPGMDSSYGQSMKKLVEEDETLRATVFFPGMLRGDAKWGAFYGCTAFILPSHQENFGISVVEALACEKPVLISNQVNIWREIEDGRGGIVASDTLEGTTALLSKWVALSQEQQKQMGQNAKSVFEKKFAIDLVAKKFSEAIK